MWQFGNILTLAAPQFLGWSMVWAEITLVTDNCHAHPDDEIVRCLLYVFRFLLLAGWPSYTFFSFKLYSSSTPLITPYTYTILD